MLGRGLRVAALVGQPLGGLQRLLGLDGEAVWLHGDSKPFVNILVCLTKIIARRRCKDAVSAGSAQG